MTKKLSIKEEKIFHELLAKVFEEYNGLNNVSVTCDATCWHDCFLHEPSLKRYYLYFNKENHSTSAIYHEYA